MYLLIWRGSDQPYARYCDKDAALKILEEHPHVQWAKLHEGRLDWDYFPENTGYVLKATSILPKTVKVVTNFELE